MATRFIRNRFLETVAKLQPVEEKIPESAWDEINENMRQFRIEFRHKMALSYLLAKNILICD